MNRCFANTPDASADQLWPLPQRSSAWQLWREFASTEAAMSKDADRARMIERHNLVVRIIEINSQQLRCESGRVGLDIERASAVRDAALPGASPDLQELIMTLDQRMAALVDESQRLARQRDFLNKVLTEFDDGVSDADNGPIGQA
jgi:hypothetical protein